MIKMGTKVKDVLNGKEGVVIGLCFYKFGSTQALVNDCCDTKSDWIEVKRLKEIKEPTKEQKKKAHEKEKAARKKAHEKKKESKVKKNAK